MILPGSYLYSLMLLTLGFLLIGSWACTYKAVSGKWRWELYYFDFAVGAAIVAVALALTMGSFGFDGFSFTDDLRLAGKRQDVFAFGSGVMFNLGNMLILGAMSLTAMSVALPIGMSVGIIVETLADLVINRASSAVFTVAGALALVGAVILLAMAWHEFAMARLMELVKQGKTKSTRRKISMRGILLSVIGGVFLGGSQPFLIVARVENIGLGPYSVGFIFALGMLFSTFVLNLFFINLPVAGEPVDVVEYFRAKAQMHFPGLLGGALFMAGTEANLVVARVEGAAQVTSLVGYSMMQAAILVAMLLGLGYWKELGGSGSKVRGQMGIAMFLIVAGIGLAAFGLPVPGR